MLQKSKPTRVPGTAVFLTSDPNVAPAALLHNLKHNKVLHERVLVICVKTEDRPRVAPEKRFEIERLSDDFYRATLHYGFMEVSARPGCARRHAQGGAQIRHHDHELLPGEGARSRKAPPRKCRRGRTSSMWR